jgi:hypothetical protein
MIDHNSFRWCASPVINYQDPVAEVAQKTLVVMVDMTPGGGC